MTVSDVDIEMSKCVTHIVAAGTGWQEALSYFHRALPALQQEKHSLSYMRLLCDLGFAYFRLNRLQESDRYGGFSHSRDVTADGLSSVVSYWI